MPTADYPTEAALLNGVLCPHFPDGVAILPDPKHRIQIVILLRDYADVDACERVINSQRDALLPVWRKYPDASVCFYVRRNP